MADLGFAICELRIMNCKTLRLSDSQTFRLSDPQIEEQGDETPHPPAGGSGLSDFHASPIALINVPNRWQARRISSSEMVSGGAMRKAVGQKRK